MKHFVLILFSLTIIELVVAQKISAPNYKLNQSEIENKTISELFLLRNAIFAKHGRPFNTYELHAYFMKQDWYKPDKNYKPSNLSQIDAENVELLNAQENKLRQFDYTIEGNARQVNIKNIYNYFQFPGFNKSESDKLSKNGFVVLPTDQDQLFHIYENNDYLGIPSFISVDAVLQLYHLYFDMSLRNIESNFMAKKLEILHDQLIKELLILQQKSQNKNIQSAIDFILAYLSVSQYFIKGKQVEIHGRHKSLALKEIENCKSQAGFSQSELLNRMIDYSQYIPRGHYTRSETLKNYFLSMMWLGNTGIDLQKEIKILASVLITEVLYTKTFEGKPLIDLWKDIYEPTVFYVGLSDDTGPIEMKAAMDEVYNGISSIDQYDNKQKLLELPGKLPDPKIVGHGSWGAQKKQFRLMGQRFIPDSYIFDRLTDQKRRMPNSLDIMAAFGNKKAENLMMNDFKESWQSKADYPKILKKLKDDNQNLSEKEWTKNLYYYWLYNLISLFDIKDKTTLPFFMTTDGWDVKTLNTSLASWSELRHNTILYTKQSVVAECGGGSDDGMDVWVPEPPKGYVEPNVEFYSRMTGLLNMTTQGLANRKMLDRKLEYTSKSFIEMLTFLKTVSEKELKKEALTLQEYEQIQKLGSLLDNLTLSVLTDEYAEWNLIEGPDRNMPVIADVHTADDKVLEVAVGKAHEIYVVVEIEGKLKLTRGAIFSFYEFPWPSSGRLTDEEWQKLLESGKAPEQPSWINYKSDMKTPKKLVPLYKPDLEVIPESSTDPGWKFIYYDTGC
jgi:hypothetical protein